MKKLLLLSTLVISTAVSAAPSIPLDQQISSVTVEEVSAQELLTSGISFNEMYREPKKTNFEENDSEETYSEYNPDPVPDRIDTAGKVISTSRDMVALGESIYALVQKGKPTNVTEYAPISVVPRDPMSKEYIDPFELEGFSMPVERNYIARVKNGLGMEVVKFSYKVLFSYGGSYNGSGKFLTNVIIVPGSVNTSFGWDFNATMKLSGIMNHGSRANPIAGVMVTIKYQMNSWSSAMERNDTIHITGRGQIKNHNI